MAIDFQYINNSGPTVDFKFDIKWSKKPSKEQIRFFDEVVYQWGDDGIQGKYGGLVGQLLYMGKIKIPLGEHFDYMGDIKHGELSHQVKDEKNSYFHLDAGSGNLEKGLKVLEKKLNSLNEEAQQHSNWAIIESVKIEG